MLRKCAALVLAVILTACSGGGAETTGDGKTIVVTYAVLGSAVRELVGDHATVIVPMPNGQDPHEWEPSAKDIESIMHADLIVQNGLGLEGGMEKTLEQAKSAGVPVFTASEHITVRHVGAGEGLPGGDPDQAAGAEDPHLWMSPEAIRQVMAALADQLKTDLDIDVSARAKDLDARLTALDQEIAAQVQTIPEADRRLVTGHESMGYFAERYHLTLVGALVPSLTTGAETSAADLAGIKQVIAKNHVKAIFTELGTPKSVADTIGQETGVKVISLSTHVLPDDGSYFTFMRDIARLVVDGLK